MKKMLAVCVVALVMTGVLARQAWGQEGIAQRQFLGWLEAFNSGDRATLQKFLEVNRPDALGRLDGTMEFRKQTGGFELKKVEENTATRFVGLLQEKDSEQFGRVVAEVETGEPHKITKLEINAAGRPAEFAVQRMSETEAVAALQAYLEKEAAADRFSGAALVAKDGKVIFSHAYGMADREKKTANQVDTQFRIGSMNKMFTATAILQLVQAGKIKLTEPFGTYLPDYANKELSSKVTIHQLLTHTGGTGDIFGPEFDAHRLELKSLQDYVKLYEKRGPEFAPGTQWKYSNYGFLLLGAVVEKVSGMNYYEYVREKIFKPAGMDLTDSQPENVNVAGRSTGYMEGDGGGWQRNTDTLPYRGSSAGGGYSTVGDLLRFATALQNHKLLDAKHTELLVSGKVDTPRGDKYAYGFSEKNAAGMKCFGHGGGAPGMNGELEICAQSGFVVAVLANLDPPAAQRMAEFVLNRLPMQ